ncbi:MULTISPECIES: MarR family winged helix-turn-helix transcriptional regulator [unclassified Microbacterium]|uniref:MarR family winged helix-turn-helix transcriptional regulator n=1 Tax=unclassified Microbacterium TaxID=2609290 RepID=UPI001401F3BE|nr:MarR family transcriptional regulator [Microbacterium sp. Gd 4-13]
MVDESSVPDEVMQATIDASGALLAIIARSLEPALEQVTVAQFRILVILHREGPTRMGALAERAGVAPSTVTRMIERMIGGGWVERETSAASRREIFVRATSRGAELVDEVMRRRKDELRIVLADVPPERQEQLRRALGAFAAAAGEAGPQPDSWPVL